jgi:putative alpha-1,2-mannosidase
MVVSLNLNLDYAHTAQRMPIHSVAKKKQPNLRVFRSVGCMHIHTIPAAAAPVVIIVTAMFISI